MSNRAIFGLFVLFLLLVNFIYKLAAGVDLPRMSHKVFYFIVFAVLVWRFWVVLSPLFSEAIRWGGYGLARMSRRLFIIALICVLSWGPMVEAALYIYEGKYKSSDNSHSDRDRKRPSLPPGSLDDLIMMEDSAMEKIRLKPPPEIKIPEKEELKKEEPKSTGGVRW